MKWPLDESPAAAADAESTLATADAVADSAPAPTFMRRLKIVPVKVATAALTALLVLIVAVTPLSATFRPAYFDMRYIQPESRSVLSATLEDQTGIISAAQFVPGATPTVGLSSALVVGWLGGCDNPSIYMKFSSDSNGYHLEERTTGDNCFLDIGYGRTFQFVLRAPINAASVEVVHD